MTALDALKSRYPLDLCNALIEAYGEIESNFTLRKWKASELDAGHFVEAARRIVEQELFGSHTPIGKTLPKFNEQVLKKYESASGDESYRILIPAVLKAMYNIRNRRGVGHLGLISPNQADATLILYSAKWVVAELLRLASGLALSETQELVERIVARRIEVLWKHEDVVKILDAKMRVADQVLILLYDRSPQAEQDLQRALGYTNRSRFTKILKDHHKARLIHRDEAGTCVITPAGIVAAEDILKKSRAT